MKRTVTAITITLLTLLAASCRKDKNIDRTAAGADRITLGASLDNGTSRTETLVIPDEHKLRYILEVRDTGNTANLLLREEATGSEVLARPPRRRDVRRETRPRGVVQRQVEAQPLPRYPSPARRGRQPRLRPAPRRAVGSGVLPRRRIRQPEVRHVLQHTERRTPRHPLARVLGHHPCLQVQHQITRTL